MARWNRRRRLAVGVTIGVALLLVSVAVWRTSTVGPARALRRDIEERASAHFPRPSHVSAPEPGTFGEHAVEAWDALAALEAASADVELCRAIRDGEQPFTALTPSCRRELASAGAPL